MIAALLLARATIGAWEDWGAFRDEARCYAIAAPAVAAGNRGARPFASVAARFGPNGRRALFVRLSVAATRAAPVTLTIGQRRFALSSDGSAAFAPDADTDAAIVAAMRGARSMSVTGVTAAGRPFADTYALGGAATAIDAATLECAG